MRRGASLLAAGCALALVLGQGLAAQAGVESGFGVAAGGNIVARQESYKTDLFTGNATLSVPLLIPPGTNGHEPRLALAYSSSAGMSWLGQGWNLSVPSIRRVTKLGVPRYDDNPLTGDRFEVDDDLLVRDDTGSYRRSRDNFDRIERTDSGGVLQSWVLHRTDGTRLEFGTDAARRVSTPTGQTFEWLLAREVDANGNFIEYTYYDRAGGELGTDSPAYLKRISYGFRGDTAGSATIRSVDFVLQDRPDHSVSYRGAVRQRSFHRVDRIEVRAGGALVTTYDLRYYGESGEGSLPANRRSLIRRIVRIGANGTSELPADVYSYSGAGAGTWTLDSTSSSRLAQLRLPSYSNGLDQPETNPQPVNLGSGNSFRLMDVNGDARSDLVGVLDWANFQRGTFVHDGSDELFPFTRPAHPYVEAYTPPGLLGYGSTFSGVELCLPSIFNCARLIPVGTRVADYDGDGRPELFTGSSPIVPNAIFDDVKLVYANIGVSWIEDTTSGYKTHAANLSVYQPNCYSASRPILVGWTELMDVNGDGLADLLEHRVPGQLSNCDINGKAAWTVRNVYLNTGDGWSATPDPTWSASLSAALTALNVFVFQLMAVDVNGDGLVDLVPDALPSLCSGSCNQNGLPGNAANGWNIADYARGSDGLADADPANPSRTKALINTGRGWASAQPDPDIVVPAGLRPVDLDGDGLVDSATASPQLNTGTGFVTAPFTMPSSFGSSAGGRVIVDVDGDAQVDLVRADGSNFQVYKSTAEPPPGHLTRVDSYLGGSIALEYQPSSGGSCYDEEDGGCHTSLVPFPTLPDGTYREADDPRCVYPWITVPGNDRCIFVFENLPFTVQTVARITTDDRNGNISVSDAAYEAGRFNHGVNWSLDREFRGFGLALKYSPTISYTDPKTSQPIQFATLEETQFYQEAFLRGEPARSVLYELPNGDRTDRSRVLEISVPEFGLAHGGSPDWAVFMTVFSGAGCDPTGAYFTDPSSCPPVGTSKADYIAFGAGLPDPNQPYQDFLAAFANPTNRDRNDAFLVLPISRLTRRFDDPLQPTLRTDYRSFQFHDRAGNVKYEWDTGTALIDDLAGTIADVTPSDDRMTLTTFATPRPSAPPNFRNRPLYQERQGLDGGGNAQALSRTWFSYDGISNGDPTGQVTNGNLTTESRSLVDSVNGLDTFVNTVLGYDATTSFGLPRTVTDPFEQGAAVYTTTYTYDASNTFRTVLQRGSLATTLGYTPPAGSPRGLGIVYSATGPNGEVTSFSADTFGRPTGESGPSPAIGAVRTTAYHDYFGWNPAVSRVTETISDGVAPIASDVFFDGNGRPMRRVRSATRPNGTPATIEELMAYDARGNLSARSRRRFCAPGGVSCDASPGQILLRYDARDRLRFLVQPNGGIAERRYETRLDPGRTYPDRYAISIDAEGRRRDVRLDGAEEISQVIEYGVANNYATDVQRSNFLYDGLGRLQLQCDPGASPCALAGRDVRNSTLFTYDSLSRVVRRDDPDRGPWRYRYLGDGSILRQTDGNNVATAMRYDAVYGRVAGVDWSANGTEDVTYRYGDEPGLGAGPNSLGRLFRKIGPVTVQEYGYDVAGRITSQETNVVGTTDQYTEAFAYDWRSRRTSTTYPDGEMIERRYDVMGLNRVFSSARVYVDRVDNNADGRPTETLYGNGELRTKTYFPSTGSLASIRGQKAPAASVLDRAYTYDLTGMLSSATDAVTPSESLTNVQYDGIRRMRAATRGGSTSLSATFDLSGNLVTKDGIALPHESATRAHALHSTGNPTLYQYDGAGNLRAKPGRTFDYDAQNRLVSASGSLPISYGYDDDRERVTKTVGADRSLFLGPDVEIMNRVRLVKTIQANGEIVARVETLLAGGSGSWTLPAFPLDLLPPRAADQAVAIAALLALAALAGALQRGTSSGLGTRAAASSLALLLAVMPLFPRLALAAVKGDVTDDGRVDSADALLLLRHVREGVSLPVDPSTGDIAPWSPQSMGDGARNVADVEMLIRGLSVPDLDGDGLTRQTEANTGTSPFSTDSDGDGILDGDEDFDQDGVSNAAELAAGTGIAAADSDGDGIVDSRDGSPLAANGTRTVWVHADHLGSASVVTDDTGVAVRQIRYGLWGEIRANDTVGGAVSLDISEKYTGQRYDSETQLHYYGARYYDSATGHFLTTDAVVASRYRSTSRQPYAYVGNNPLNYVDPSGNITMGLSGGNAGGGGGTPFLGGHGTSGFNPYALDSMMQEAMLRAIADMNRVPKSSPAGPQTPAQPAGTQVADAFSAKCGFRYCFDGGPGIWGGGGGGGGGGYLPAAVGGAAAGAAIGGAAVLQQNAEPKEGSEGGEGAGKPFSDNVKDQAREESGNTCVFCGTETTEESGPSRSEIDHAIPKSRGGNNSPDNAQNTCRTCNRSKGSKTTGEFLGR